MPYNRVLVQRASGITIMPQRYLSCYVGRANSDHKSQRQNLKPLGRVVVKEYAHRLLCYAFHGQPGPDQTVVSHTCNNPTCLNPKHLKWATQEGNMNNTGEESDESEDEV
jgi:hypothetical protein